MCCKTGEQSDASDTPSKDKGNPRPAGTEKGGAEETTHKRCRGERRNQRSRRDRVTDEAVLFALFWTNSDQPEPVYIGISDKPEKGWSRTDGYQITVPQSAVEQ